MPVHFDLTVVSKGFFANDSCSIFEKIDPITQIREILQGFYEEYRTEIPYSYRAIDLVLCQRANKMRDVLHHADTVAQARLSDEDQLIIVNTFPVIQLYQTGADWLLHEASALVRLPDDQSIPNTLDPLEKAYRTFQQAEQRGALPDLILFTFLQYKSKTRLYTLLYPIIKELIPVGTYEEVVTFFSRSFTDEDIEDLTKIWHSVPPQFPSPAPSPPPSPPPPLTFQGLVNAWLFDELVKCFSTKTVAELLLVAYGFPKEKQPNFDNKEPREYWQIVCTEIEKGTCSGGFEALLAAAARELPNNEKFSKYKTSP